jgi:hypothetical protein
VTCNRRRKRLRNGVARALNEGLAERGKGGKRDLNEAAFCGSDYKVRKT